MTEIPHALVRSAQSGDQGACRAIVEALQRPLLATIHRFLGRRFAGEAEDIAQDVFLKLFRSLDRFDPDRGVKFTTWVYALVRNHCFDVLKRRRLGTISMTPADEDAGPLDLPDRGRTDPADLVSDSEVGRLVEEALGKLTEEQRFTFVLREYQGLDHAEIASVMETTEGTVKSRLFRAKAALRERLAPYLKTTP